MIIGGFLITAIFVFWSSFIFTSNTGTEAMFWPLIVRGFGMAFLFVPLSGLTLGGLNGKDVGQASGISNMIRQIGGSMSVAIIGVLNETLSAQHRANILEHVTTDNTLVSDRLNAMKAGLMSATSDAQHASQQALAFLDYSINKQAAILSYIDIFHYMTVFIVCAVPLVLFAKTYKINKDDLGGH
jgi:DHA2 family multidrug resistance protein